MSLLKFLLHLLLGIFFLCFWAFSTAFAAEREDVEKVANIFLNEPHFAHIVNLANHDNFPWHWMRYTGKVEFGNLTLVTAEYQMLASPGRQVVITFMQDGEADGTVDFWWRQFYIEDDNNTIMLPFWPEGLRNMDWYNPTIEEVQEHYDKTVELLKWVDTKKD